jgi:hypothetical protein
VKPPVVTPPVVTPPVVTPPVVTPPVVTPPVVTPPVVTPPVVTPPVVTPTGRPTVVSLTFDDADANQMTAAAILQANGQAGTFYIVSGYVGASGYLSQANLSSLAAAGHEIGGHTVTHPDLTTLPPDEVQRQVCTDRSTLLGWGFAVRSFAYPFAASTPADEAAVAGCGYNSARMLGDIASRFGCADCDSAESMPPADPYYTKALDQVDSTWTLADMQTAVTNAEKTGGWLQFTFHNVCDSGCGDLNVTPALLSQFSGWLATRAATTNTVVRTVGDVVGGAVQPAVAGPVVVPPTGTDPVENPSLENQDTTGGIQCWFQAPYGDNTAVFSTVSPGHSGSVASKITMSNYVSGDAKILPTFDLGSCAPGTVEGHSYSLRAWYQSSVVTQFAVYLRTTAGAWQYWTSSPWFSGSTTWTEAEWTTSTIPTGFTGISFGLNIFSNGELITDDYSIYDSVDAPPASTIPPTPPVAPVTEPAPPAEAPAAPITEESAPQAPATTPVEPTTAPEPESVPTPTAEPTPEPAPAPAPEPAPALVPAPALAPATPPAEVNSAPPVNGSEVQVTQ